MHIKNGRSRLRLLGGCRVAAAASHANGPKQKNDEVADQNRVVEIAPRSSDEVAQYTHRVEDFPYLSHAQKLELLRKHIKYVFVLFQENRSFDFYFGTYPGARACSRSPRANSWFYQPIVNTAGGVETISPFLIPQSVRTSTAIRCCCTRGYGLRESRPHCH